MLAIASLMNLQADQKTFQIWNLLEELCMLSQVKMAPIPHFSWQSAEDYDLEPLLKTIEECANRTCPFRLYTGGMGIFSGKDPVFYLALVKNHAMIDLHELLWNKAQQYAIKMNSFYQPDFWIPHITLAHQDINSENLSCAIQNLMHAQLMFEFQVDNLAVLYRNEVSYGTIARFDLKGDSPA